MRAGNWCWEFPAWEKAPASTQCTCDYGSIIWLWWGFFREISQVFMHLFPRLVLHFVLFRCSVWSVVVCSVFRMDLTDVPDDAGFSSFCEWTSHEHFLKQLPFSFQLSTTNIPVCRMKWWHQWKRFPSTRRHSPHLQWDIFFTNFSRITVCWYVLQATSTSSSSTSTISLFTAKLTPAQATRTLVLKRKLFDNNQVHSNTFTFVNRYCWGGTEGCDCFDYCRREGRSTGSWDLCCIFQEAENAVRWVFSWPSI